MGSEKTEESQKKPVTETELKKPEAPVNGHGKITVAVIGTGYAGLCALRHFTADERYAVTAFERAAHIGGVWNYPEGCEENPAADATSPYYSRMFKNMRTNLPKDLMALEGYPFPKDDSCESYCDVDTVRRYMLGYVKHFDLSSYIKLSHRVNNVTPILTDDPPEVGPQWSVTVEDLTTKQISTQTFDAVLVCVGRTHKPYWPDIPDMTNFKGTVMHSCHYREPERFTNQVVLVIGGATSARDITIDLLSYAKKVILSQRNVEFKVHGDYPDKPLIKTGIIAKYYTDRIQLQDGSIEPCDAVILATGYVQDFSFLSEACHVNATRERILPLYRHLIHAEYPTMAFPFILTLITITPVMDVQMKYYKAVLDGKVKLPSTQEMLTITEREFEEHAKNSKSIFEQHHVRFHGLAQRNWPYMEAMAKEAGFVAYEPVIKKMCGVSLNWILNEPGPNTYKYYRLEKIDSENFLVDQTPPSGS